MKTHPATGKELIPPLWYALGAIVATPLVALCMVMAGILMILGWPFIPILCYFQRKEEISKANAERIHGGAGLPKQPETPTPLDGASC